MSDRTQELCVGHAIWTLREQINELHRWLPIGNGDYQDLCVAKVELECLIHRIEAMQLTKVA